MKSSEAVEWLYRHGGRWSVRATSAVCLVTVAIGARQLTVRTSRLDSTLVGEAIAEAVDELKSETERP
jgi:hypothetical protein